MWRTGALSERSDRSRASTVLHLTSGAPVADSQDTGFHRHRGLVRGTLLLAVPTAAAVIEAARALVATRTCSRCAVRSIAMAMAVTLTVTVTVAVGVTVTVAVAVAVTVAVAVAVTVAVTVAVAPLLHRGSGFSV